MKRTSPRRITTKKNNQNTSVGSSWFIYCKLILFVAITAVISGILDSGGSLFLNSWWPLMWGLFWFVLGLTKVISISSKSGVGLGFILIFSLVTLNVNDVGIFGWEKVKLFFLMGLLFEILFFLFKHKSLYWAKVLATFISLTTLPLIASVVVSGGWIASLSVQLINMIILIGAVSLVLSLIFGIISQLLRTKTWFLKLEAWLSY